MDWVVFAFLAPILWSVCNVIDKFLLEKRIRNPISYQIIITLFNTISIIIILLIAPISTNVHGFLLGMITGLLGVIAVIFYNKSMIYEEASRVVPLAYLSSIVVLILAYIFLGEFFNFEKYLGVIFIFIGGGLISYKKTKKKWYFSSAVKFILISAFLWGVSSVISKYTLGFIDFFTLTLWQLLGYLIFGPLFLLSYRVRISFLKDIRKFNKKIIILMIMNTLIYLIAVLAFLYATANGMISLVYAIASTQPFFIFIYMLIVTKLAPKIVKERIDKSTISLKIMAILLIVLGSWLTVF